MEQPVAITGATGFVGAHLLEALLGAGYRVRVLVRDVSRLEKVAGQVDIVEGDLDNLAALKQLVSGARVVIHCAGAIAALNRQGFFGVNQRGAENVARAAVAAGVNRFIHVSSLAAREPQLSSYGASKKAGEDIVREVVGREHLVIVRPPAVYGPGDRATLPLIRALTQKRAILPGRADQKISLLYVKDLASLLVALVDHRLPDSDVLEVDDGRVGGYRFDDLVQLAGQTRGKKIALTLMPRAVVAIAGLGAMLVSQLSGKAFVLSPEKVAELYHRDWVAKGAKITGWQPQCQFAEGFELTLAWYRENGWLPGGRARAKSANK